MAKVGRPLKFESKEELSTAKNGLVEFPHTLLKDDTFNKEKELEEYIVDNIDCFVKDILEDELVSFEVNKHIDVQHFSPRGRRIDLVVVCTRKTYLIELKNPSSGTENRSAIGQILDYGREYLDPKKELVILTTKFDINTSRTIKHYGLPIRYIYIDRNRIMEQYND